MRVALYRNGLVERIAVFADDAEVPATIDGLATLVSENALQGDIVANGAIVPPDPEAVFVAAQAEKLAMLAARRWQAEIGGLTIAGAPIRTDQASQAKITGAVSLFAADQTLTSIDWE